MGLWRRILVFCHLGFALNLASPVGAVISPRLSSMLIRVNQDEREIKAGETLEVVRGDQLTILFAKLDKSSRGPEIINLMGFRREDVKTRHGDDRDVLIDTNQLLKKWSLDRKGEHYRIEAKSGASMHGMVRLSVIQPKLQNLELMINNGLRTLGPGDSLELMSSDAVQVKTIRTNHRRIDEETKVIFQEGPVSQGRKKVDLQLWYRTYQFASLSLYLKQD